ncbi:GntR family transcriptional regulator [Sinomonas mesophila]|uniref:GntR family transcriptional regulator n=1 Tax=Sinomonas mesophila TaxID=1531955 RepID=UPI0009852D01|nr:GntR family transcriptional regulator [Sinomonas mesophila]
MLGPISVRRPPRPSATARAVESLRLLLAERSWGTGDKLPSEPALATQIGVSRVSVRAALAILESEGLVTRRRGSGTYLTSVRPIVNSLHLNTGSSQLLRSRGRVPGISEMSWREVGADAEVAVSLGLELGTPVIDLYRVRTSDGTPVTVEHGYFAASLLPEQMIDVGPSLYDFLSTACGVDVVFGIATLEPAPVGEELSGIFGVGSEELCLVMKQVDYDAAERSVAYCVERHLADAFDFQLVRQPPVHPASRPGRP